MKSLLIANWKMNPLTLHEAQKLLESTVKASNAAREVSVIIAPPALYLIPLRAGYRGKKVAFGVQNAHFENTGSFTGEISMEEARNAGASHAIIGHAERRAMGESNEDTRKKVAAALSLNIVPILCVGEKARGYEGEHLIFIKEQLRAGFSDVAPGKVARVIVAYEPIWAIGAEEAMNPRDMHEMAIFIRKTLVELCSEKAMGVRILYGGSIDEGNAVAMIRQGDVAGLLVGRASARKEKITQLIRAIKEV
ncbi:MAG TPA: triose-phosphate isomerase [Candidatus Paceibacterota bacterium]|nr:triose-phosphate isomerase [Candidatus Paceibacterota bacterium]